jgi:hypothetical protein
MLAFPNVPQAPIQFVVLNAETYKMMRILLEKMFPLDNFAFYFTSAGESATVAFHTGH